MPIEFLDRQDIGHLFKQAIVGTKNKRLSPEENMSAGYESKSFLFTMIGMIYGQTTEENDRFVEVYHPIASINTGEVRGLMRSYLENMLRQPCLSCIFRSPSDIAANDIELLFEIFEGFVRFKKGTTELNICEKARNYDPGLLNNGEKSFADFIGASIIKSVKRNNLRYNRENGDIYHPLEPIDPENDDEENPNKRQLRDNNHTPDETVILRETIVETIEASMFYKDKSRSSYEYFWVYLLTAQGLYKEIDLIVNMMCETNRLYDNFWTDFLHSAMDICLQNGNDPGYTAAILKEKIFTDNGRTYNENTLRNGFNTIMAKPKLQAIREEWKIL